MIFDSRVSFDFVDQTKEALPFVAAKSKLDPCEWFLDNKDLLEECILKHGGIVFRDFGLNSISEFNKIVHIISPNLLEYEYGSTPRTRLGGKIYTATEYPADRKIPLHNENSYTNSWPKKIFFFSVITAKEGGETPVADSRLVYNMIDRDIRDKFEKKGILYTRNFTPGIDLSWQEVFQTDDQSKVNEFCQKKQIDYSWQEGQNTVLRTRQVCQASTRHPKTGEYSWFNQAHLFHISSLSNDDISYLIRELGNDNLPRNTYYGDGSEIEIESLEHIRDCYEKQKISFLWKEGDIMILDNILFAHGREAYKGDRKIAVAMS